MAICVCLSHQGDLLDEDADLSWVPVKEVQVKPPKAAANEGDAQRSDAGPADLCKLPGGGTIVFSDINITSGMEQASFLFQQVRGKPGPEESKGFCISFAPACQSSSACIAGVLQAELHLAPPPGCCCRALP